jgi:hypothetical protein
MAHEHRSVLVRDGLIVDGDYRGKAPEGARVVEGKGRTLLPGLIDAHVHSWQHFELPLVFGVTTQVDMFTGVEVMQRIQQQMAAGRNQGEADLFSAGTLVTAPGGHGEGKTSGEIAKLVHLSEGTVRNYLSEAISKLNAGNRIEAYWMARNAGWL